MPTAPPSPIGDAPVLRRPARSSARARARAAPWSGMQPQIRQVPPSAFCFSTTATFRPSCAARIAATYPPVPAPIDDDVVFVGQRFRIPGIGHRLRDERGTKEAPGAPRLAQAGRGRSRVCGFEPAEPRRPAARARIAAPSKTRTRRLERVAVSRRAFISAIQRSAAERRDAPEEGQQIPPYRTACNSVNRLPQYRSPPNDEPESQDRSHRR